MEQPSTSAIIDVPTIDRHHSISLAIPPSLGHSKSSAAAKIDTPAIHLRHPTVSSAVEGIIDHGTGSASGECSIDLDDDAFLRQLMAWAEQAQQEEHKELSANLEPDIPHLPQHISEPQLEAHELRPSAVITSDHDHHKHERKR